MREALGWTAAMAALIVALLLAGAGCLDEGGEVPGDDDAGDDDAGDDDGGDDDGGEVVLWAGGPADSADVPFPHCVYRHPLDGAPEPVVCEEVDEVCRILSWTAPPDPARRVALVATELIVAHECQANPYPEYDGIYEFGVQELWRVDLDGGEAQLWSHHLGANYFGEPHRYLEELGWLPGGRAVLDLMGFGIVPGAPVSREIVVLDAAGERSADLLPDHLHKELVGTMADGGVVIETDDPAEPDDAELWWVDPDTRAAELLVPADGQSFGHVIVAPDGEAVLYERSEDNGDARVAVVTRTDEARLDADDAGTTDLLGWTTGGRVLLARGAQLLTWNGADGGTAEDLTATPPGDWHPWQVIPGPERAAVREWDDAAGDRVRLVGDDGSSVPCPAVGRIDAPQWIGAGAGAGVIYGDGEQVRTYRCDAAGEAEDLLAPHGMRGLPLGFEPPLGH